MIQFGAVAFIHPDSKRDEIVAYLRRPDRPPFIAIAAEACGIRRSLVHEWLKAGTSGDPRYAKFAADVYKIRAEYIGTLTNEIMTGGDLTRGDIEANKHKAWLLQRLDRETFDPPKETYEKAKLRPEMEPTPPAAEADRLEAATNLLSTPQEKPFSH